MSSPAVDGYPILLHFLISRLPRQTWQPAGLFLNIISDISTAMMVYAATWIAVGQSQTNIGISAPGLAALLFLTMPILFPITSRLRTINARTVGLPFVFVFLVLLHTLLDESYPLEIKIMSLVCASLIFTLHIAMSMFATQVCVFFAATLAIAYMSLVPLYPLLIGLAISFIPALGIKTALGMHWHFKIWYWRNYQKGTSASQRNQFSSLKRAMSQRRFSSWLRYIVADNTVTAAIIGVPGLVLLALVLDGSHYSGIQDFNHFCVIVVIASLLSFILTSVPRFSFLGQAERYFEYSAPFIAILLAANATSLSAEVLWSLILIHVIGVFLFALASNAVPTFKQDSGIPTVITELGTWFSQNAPTAKILPVPVKLTYLFSAMSYQGSFPEKTSFYFRYALRPDDVGYSYFERDMESPFGDSREIVTGRDPLDMAEEYGLTHMVFEKRFLSTYHPDSPYVSLSQDQKRVLYENSEYLILSLKG